MRSRPRTPDPIEVPPGRITAITPSPRAPGRFDLVVDGNPAARLSIEALERFALHVGSDISSPIAVAIGAEAQIIRTYDRAMSMLAVRGRASGELRRLLLQKGEAPATLNEAIRRLQLAGFLDDASFAKQFTRWKAVSGGLSRRRIERELTRRGIDRATASIAIADTFAEEGVDENAEIERVAERKLRTLGKVDRDTQRRRLYGFLARRGYDADTIGPLVKRLTSDQKS